MALKAHLCTSAIFSQKVPFPDFCLKNFQFRNFSLKKFHFYFCHRVNLLTLLFRMVSILYKEKTTLIVYYCLFITRGGIKCSI